MSICGIRIWTGLVVAALVAMSACGEGVSNNPGEPDAAVLPAKHPVTWTPRPGLTLTADDFYIVAGGVKFVGTLDKRTVESDKGSGERTTLEVTWMENGVEMRLNIYFKSFGTSWLSEEIRTYNGKSGTEADWIYYKGTFFATPTGETFTGDLDLTTDQSAAIPGSIHFENLKLSVTFNQL